MLTDSNDPYAGSPTKTLLRLLLPLDKKVQPAFQTSHAAEAVASPVHCLRLLVPSVGATGGVYKEQGRSRYELLTRVYEEFLVQDGLPNSYPCHVSV